MAERVEVQIGWFYYFLMLLLGLPTLGILSILLWMTTRTWPRTLDDEYLTLRNGTRIPWKECTNVVKQPMGLTQLIFGATTVQVPRISIRRGREVIAWIRKRLGLPPE
jgi:hypothetical protein